MTEQPYAPATRNKARWIDRVTIALVVYGSCLIPGMIMAEGRSPGAVILAMTLPIVVAVPAAIWSHQLGRAIVTSLRAMALLLAHGLRFAFWVGIAVLFLFILVRLIHYFWYW